MWAKNTFFNCCFLQPHSVCASAARIRVLDVALLTTSSVCTVNESDLSRSTPSRRGFSLKGMMVLSIVMDGWYLASRVEVVKNAEVLFSELSAIFQRLLHSATISTVS